MTCATCGREGGHGFRGLSRCPFVQGDAHAVKQDTIVGGFVAENAWREPRYFDSQRQYEKALDQSGLMLKPRKTRGDQGLLDPQTLANAEALVRRAMARTKSVEIAETVLDDTMTVQAEC